MASIADDVPLSSTQVPHSSAHLLVFNIDITDRDIISSAELRLRYNILDKSTLKEQDRQSIYIWHMIKVDPNSNHGSDERTIYCAGAEVSLEEGGYVSFNATTAINKWINDNMLKETCEPLYIEVYVHILQSEDEAGLAVEKPPAIEIDYTYSKTTQLVLKGHSINDVRWRRQVGTEIDPFCSVLGSRNCCKRDLVVDIQRELNWTWVLRPRMLSASYCSGLCSLNWPVATYHTLLNLMHAAHRGNPTGSPSPCCVPDKFAPIPFLIFNRTRLELVSIDDISIEKCICR